MFLKASIPLLLLLFISVSGLQTRFGRTNEGFLGPLESHISFSNQQQNQFLQFTSNNQACSCQEALDDNNLYEIDRCQCLSSTFPAFSQLEMMKGDFEDALLAPSIFLSQKFVQKQLDKDSENVLSPKEQKTEALSNQDAVIFSEMSSEWMSKKKVKYAPRKAPAHEDMMNLAEMSN